MSFAMLVTMLLCFALTVSVAVSIGLSSILGIQLANANMLISVKEISFRWRPSRSSSWPAT